MRMVPRASDVAAAALLSMLAIASAPGEDARGDPLGFAVEAESPAELRILNFCAAAGGPGCDIMRLDPAGRTLDAYSLGPQGVVSGNPFTFPAPALSKHPLDGTWVPYQNGLEGSDIDIADFIRGLRSQPQIITGGLQGSAIVTITDGQVSLADAGASCPELHGYIAYLTLFLNPQRVFTIPQDGWSATRVLPRICPDTPAPVEIGSGYLVNGGTAIPTAEHVFRRFTVSAALIDAIPALAEGKSLACPEEDVLAVVGGWGAEDGLRFMDPTRKNGPATLEFRNDLRHSRCTRIERLGADTLLVHLGESPWPGMTDAPPLQPLAADDGIGGTVFTVGFPHTAVPATACPGKIEPKAQCSETIAAAERSREPGLPKSFEGFGCMSVSTLSGWSGGPVLLQGSDGGVSTVGTVSIGRLSQLTGGSHYSECVRNEGLLMVRYLDRDQPLKNLFSRIAAAAD